jgi:hypothetical protein
MKTINIYLAIIFTLILVNGCSENITNPPEDDILNTQLIGKWEAKNYETLILNNDGTFIDTSLAISEDNPNKYVPHCVVTGKYSIADNILYFYDVTLQYAKAASVTPPAVAFAATFEPRKIIVNGNELNLQTVKILNPLESYYPNLNGKWESTSWIAVFDRDIQPQYKGGKRNEVFNFFSDSLKVNYSVEYLFNTSLSNSNYITDYSFDGTNFQYQNTTYQVEFKNNKMYLFRYSINYSKK